MRTLPAADEPCVLAPGRQVHEIGELGHRRRRRGRSRPLRWLRPSPLPGTTTRLLSHLASTGWPIEYSMFASTRPRTKPWVAPAESALTRMWCRTRPGSSPGSWPNWYSGGRAADRLVQQLEVVVGVVRAGVARTQHRRERLVRSCRTRRRGDESHSRACRSARRLASRSERLTAWRRSRS